MRKAAVTGPRASKRKGVAASAASRTLALRGGGRVTVSKGTGSETVRLLGEDGTVRLEVLVTPDGVVLRLAGPKVAIEAEGSLAIRCAAFEVEAERISLGASGDVVQRAGRALDLRAGHDAALSAQAVTIEGRRGGVAVSANDDVALNGERVLLNCPTDEEVEKRAREAATLKDLLELPFQAPGSPRRLPPSEPVREEAP